tara:strand:+ start:188 stop:709 length:522 start_codon:yes stop_codon:yes gene_type:complete
MTVIIDTNSGEVSAENSEVSVERSRTSPALETVLRDSAQPVSRPNRMAPDVWATMREYVEGGGLLDLAEDVAALSALEQEVRTIAQVSPDDVSPKDKFDAIIKIVEKRGRLKESYLKMHKERQNFITYEMFSVFLEDLYEILSNHISNPTLLRAIGTDLAGAAQAMQRRINGG